MPPRRVGLACWALACLLPLAPSIGSAANPIGTFEIALGGNQSIWVDANAGESEFCEGFEEGFGGSLQACDFSLSLDAKGKITGSVEVLATNGDLSVSLAGPIKGKLKGDGQSGLSDLAFSMKLGGEASDGLLATGVSARVSFEGRIDGAGQLTGAWSSSFCSKADGCVSDLSSISPEIVDGGDWNLVLAIEDLADGKLGGSAAVELADGSQCPYSIKGKYDAEQDVASLKLSATNAACSGTSISLGDVRTDTTLMAQIRYKLFGQRGDAAVESVDD